MEKRIAAIIYLIVSLIVLLEVSILTVASFLVDRHFMLIFIISAFVILVILGSYFYIFKKIDEKKNKKLELLRECLEKSGHTVFTSTEEVFLAVNDKGNVRRVMETGSEFSESIKYICRALSEV